MEDVLLPVRPWGLGEFPDPRQRQGAAPGSGLKMRSTSNSFFEVHASILSYEIYEVHTSTFRPFSAVSTSIFATKYSLVSIFRRLQDVRSFAPLQTQQ